MMSNEFFSSKLPVGSSQRIKSTSLAIPRAIATLCCCPPDSCRISLLHYSLESPSCSRIDKQYSFLSFLLIPAISKADITFSKAFI